MFEAGTFPAMWAHLTRFYAGGTHLAAAWGFIGAAQPLAQVALTDQALFAAPVQPCVLGLQPLDALFILSNDVPILETCALPLGLHHYCQNQLQYSTAMVSL